MKSESINADVQGELWGEKRYDDLYAAFYLNREGRWRLSEKTFYSLGEARKWCRENVDPSSEIRRYIRIPKECNRPRLKPIRKSNEKATESDETLATAVARG